MGEVDWCTRWQSVGYELHITRAAEWFSSAAKPIAQSEWSQVAGGDARLIPSTDPTTFNFGDGNGPVLYWVDGQINVKGIDRPEQITELSYLAQRLEAALQGDDGETYDPGAVVTSPDELVIRPLTPARLADLAVLFGQGGDPKWCWCAYFRVRGLDWTNSTAANNRDVLEAAVRDDALEDRAPGLVAYRNGEAIGWVGMSPCEEYERLAYSKLLAPIDDRPVWSIVCFVVGRKTRGQGVAAALLDAAIEYARGHGARTLEAYPVEIAKGERRPAANLFHGTLTMFERAGFGVVERRQFNATSPVRPIVRLEL